MIVSIFGTEEPKDPAGQLCSVNLNEQAKGLRKYLLAFAGHVDMNISLLHRISLHWLHHHAPAQSRQQTGALGPFSFNAPRCVCDWE
jgi:hypothetical protein